MVRKISVLAIATVVLGGVLAGPAMADHTHVRLLGNGMCVYLAADGGEKYVELPNVDSDLPENRRHPLHTNAHLGEPGVVNGQAVIFVAGSPDDLANCNGYVNP